MLDNITIQRFASLFQGYSKAYGTSKLTGKTSDKGKAETVSLTVRGEAELKHYAAHLQGVLGLGIVLLRDDDTATFAVIDYDVYGADIEKADTKVQSIGLPLIPIKSKSGGIHFYCFFDQPIQARLVIERLTEWASMLGISHVGGKEIEKFPKQTTRFNEDDTGSFINLPYFNAEATSRYAVIGGRPATFAEFLDYAESHKISFEQVSKLWVAEKTELFKDGPPCLQQLESQGPFMEGTRNDGMVAVITYLKKRYPDSWKLKVDEYNKSMANLPSEEIQHLIKSIGRKTYNYRCKQAPINSHCQRGLCLKRAFGVGAGADDDDFRSYEVNGLTRYDHGAGEEPIWTMEINAKRVQMTTQQLYSKDEFNKQCMSQIGIVPFPGMTPKKWLIFLNRFIPTADIIQMPAEASPAGQVWEWITKFCTQKVYAGTKEEIQLGGKPYRDGGMVWFRIADLITYLDNHRVQYKSPQSVSMLLHQRGAEKAFWNIKNRGMNVWGLKIEAAPEFEEPPAARVVGMIKPSEAF